MNKISAFLTNIQRQIYEQTSQRTDAYYTEGKGAIFVGEYKPLVRSNVIFAIDDLKIHMSTL